MSATRSRWRMPDDPAHIAWAGRLTVQGHGAVIVLRTSDESILPALRAMVPPGMRTGNAVAADAVYSVVVRRRDAQRTFAPTHLLYEGARCVLDTHDLDALLATLESELHFKLALCARTKLFVHAGVVGWRGGAILLPGRSHAGKSTLVAALVRAGAIYYSDEYAVLDGDGLVHPFARALALREPNGQTRHVSPQSLGASIGSAPVPVGLVVATRFARVARWRPRAMSPGQTVLTLLDNTLAARTRPADTLRILSRSVMKARALRGPRGESDGVAERILASCLEPPMR